MECCLTALLHDERFLWRVVQCVTEILERIGTTNSRSLGALLEDKDILWHVLQRVEDVDVQECRLVCRRWRDASYDLPVKLKVSVPIEAESLTSLARFHRAHSIHFSNRDGCWKPLSPTNRRDVLRCLAPLKHVTAVTSDPPGDFVLDVLRDAPEGWSDTALVKSLGDRWRDKDDPLSPFLKSTMQLAALIDRPTSRSKALATSTPLTTELTLRLHHWMDLLNHQTLPPMPHLTHLQIVRTSSTPVHFALEEWTLQKCLPRLVSLSINTWERLSKSSMDSTAFKLLTHLESLELEGIEILGDDVFLALSSIKGLHTLKLTHVWIQHHKDRFERLSQLKCLQSLTIYPILNEFQKEMPPPDLRDFVRLTKLHIYSCHSADSLPCVTSLKDIDISFCGGGRILRTHLLSLVHLESLVVDIPVELPYRFLVSLTKLKRLTLRGEGAKQTDLMSAVASLPNLTSLEFDSWFADGRYFLRSLSHKSSLQSLTIRNEMQKPLSGCIILGRGYLTRLKHLTLIHFAHSPDEVEELKRSLPSLRKLQLK